MALPVLFLVATVSADVLLEVTVQSEEWRGDRIGAWRYRLKLTKSKRSSRLGKKNGVH